MNQDPDSASNKIRKLNIIQWVNRLVGLIAIGARKRVEHYFSWGQL